MGVTRLKRKGQKNRAVSATRTFSIKHLTATPVIKNVDIEELKKSFSAPKKETKKAEAPKDVEAPVVGVAAEQEAEAKPAKKAAAKKEGEEKAPKAKAAKKSAE